MSDEAPGRQCRRVPDGDVYRKYRDAPMPFCVLGAGHDGQCRGATVWGDLRWGAAPAAPVCDQNAGASRLDGGGDPLDFGAELGATWRERIESVIDEEIDAGIASGERRGAEDFARAIADEFGVADNQWVTMADPYTLPFPARGAMGTEVTYAEVGGLPPGSWVLELNQNGAPAFGTATTPIVTTSYPMRRPTKAAADRLLVVARGRASGPVRVPAVGDSVRTAGELFRLPAATVILTPRGMAAQKREPLTKNVWELVGRSNPIVNDDPCLLPARVIDLPAADQGPTTDGDSKA